METRIYISNKIQKNYKKIVLNPLPEKSDMENHQNSWNANYIAIHGKKCWVLTHSQTRYTVIVPDIKVKAIENFLNYFLDNLINQLIKKHIGKILFSQFMGQHSKLILASVIAMAPMFTLSRIFDWHGPLSLLLVLLVSISGYFLIAKLLRVTEISMITELLRSSRATVGNKE